MMDSPGCGRSWPAPVAAFLFDLDGTLVDTEPLHHEATNRVLARFDRILPWEDYAPCIGMSESAYWTKLVGMFGLGAGPEALAVERTTAMLEVIRTRPVTTMPGVTGLLDALRERGIPCAVASSSPREQIEATLASAGIRDRFRALRSGHDDVARSKPAPDVYLAAAKALGVDPVACVAVEDSVPGAAAARAAGAFVVAVRGTHGSPWPEADLRVVNVAEITRVLAR